MIPLSPTSMIRSQKFKNFQFLGFFIIWFSSKDLPLFFKFLLENFSLVKWFFGLVFWVGFSGGNFEGANLTRLDSIEIHSGSFFSLSDDDWRKILFLHILYSQYLTLLTKCSLSPSTSQGEREILLATGFFKLLHQNLELWFYQKIFWYN